MEEQTKNSENEHTNRVLQLTINGNRYHWHQQYITGAEIRKLGNISTDDEIYLAIKKPWEEEFITEDKEVNLARPEIEHFYSKDKHFKVELIINLREKLWTEKIITFEQVVVLAYGTYENNQGKIYTITYDRGPHENPEGSLIEGSRVFVKNKMIFNVKQADKS